MSLFRRTSPERDKLAEEIRGLKTKITDLEIELQALTRQLATAEEATELRAQADELRQQITDLEISKSKLEEANDRKLRDVTHKTGLLKLQQEHEVANAKRETEVAVREENLKADKSRFEAEMKFQREQTKGEMDRLDRILTSLMERLPNIEASLNVDRSDTAVAGNGRARGRAGE